MHIDVINSVIHFFMKWGYGFFFYSQNDAIFENDSESGTFISACIPAVFDSLFGIVYLKDLSIGRILGY